MKRTSNRVTPIMALAIGIGLTAIQSNAQQGTFNLPVRAHWGDAVLEPGEHTVRIPLPVGQTLVYLGSRGATQIAVPLTSESTGDANRSYLHLAKVNGEYYVDEYQSGASGKRFIFHKPRTTRSESSGGEEVEPTLVNVAGN